VRERERGTFSNWKKGERMFESERKRKENEGRRERERERPTSYEYLFIKLHFFSPLSKAGKTFLSLSFL
jgi:hypothetical protein